MHPRRRRLPRSHVSSSASKPPWPGSAIRITVGNALAAIYISPRVGSTADVAKFAPLRAVHSGHVGDYVAWLVLGTGVIGGLLAATIR